MFHINLPVEIQVQILRYCKTADLTNLACSCSAYNNDTLKQILWECVQLQGKQLKRNNNDDANKLPMLRFTKVLRISNSCGEKMGSLRVNMDMNFETALKHGQPEYVPASYTPYRVFGHHLNLTNLVELRVRCVKHIRDGDIQNICKILTALKILEIVMSPFNKDIMTVVVPLTHKILQDLSSFITDKAFIYLDKLTSLEELYLTHCPVRELNVSSMLSLKKLILTGCRNVTNKSLSHVKDLVSLREIQLSGCRNISNSVSNLTGLVALEKLSLEYCKRLNDSGIEFFKPLLALKELNVQSAVITDYGVSIISTLTCLEELYISVCMGLSDIALLYVTKLSKLRKLDISRDNASADNKYTDAGIAYLQTLTKLEILIAESCSGITGAAFSQLCNLKELHLSFCRMTNEDLRPIGNLKALEYLDISAGNRVTDAGMDHLTSLTALTRLGLLFTKVTDDGVSKLNGLTNLKRIDRDLFNREDYEDIAARIQIIGHD